MSEAFDKLEDRLSDQYWRLNNLYWITTKLDMVEDGSGEAKTKRVKFVMNASQEALFEEMDYRNVILKARQLGFTTFICLFILDSCLFNRDIHAGIIAHTLGDAESIFRDKILYPYNNLHQSIRDMVKADTSRSKALGFSNDSHISVSASYRSGTLDILHVSEYGKLSVKRPAAAEEIKTGAFEAVAQGSMIFVESTAEGREGEFYDLVDTSLKHKNAHKPVGPMDWKFHFHSWYEDPEYRTDPSSVVMTEEFADYFESLAIRGIELDSEQKAWYIKKTETLGDKMHQEHPSFPEEAFEAAIKGAYYEKAMTAIRGMNRIGNVPYEPGSPVNTFWDLGMDDSMAIWFHQRVGVENRLIDYYENSGEDLRHYLRVLQEKNYAYGMHYMPHDASHRSLHNKDRLEDFARKIGIKPLTVVPRAKNQDSVMAAIEKVRQFILTSWIDEGKCAKGITHLDNYRKDWDDRLGCFKRTPLHNAASHGADSLRTGAVGFESQVAYRQEDLEPDYVEDIY